MRRPVPISGSSNEEILSKKKKKKVKSTSKKRHSSSDSEDGSRSPKKISKSKKLASKKKKKDYKKSEKKRKKSKRYSSSDCSTCSNSDKSSSPVRKSKKRKRVKEKGRKKLRTESKRKRHRSSSSYFTCSGRTRSWDSDPNQNEEHLESSPKEKFEHKIQNDEHIESSFRQSPFDEIFKANYSDKIDGSDGQSLLDDRYGISYRQSPIIDRFEGNFVQSSIEESFESIYQNNLNEKGSRRLRSIIAVKSLDEDADNISKTCDEKLSFGSDEIYDKGNMRTDFEMEHREKEKEAVDLELILRQKALENLKKFRATRTAKVDSHNDKIDETSKGENLDQSLQIAEKTLEPKSSSSVVDQSTESKGSSIAKSSVFVVDQSTDLKGSPVVNLSGNRIFKDAVQNLPNDSSRNGILSEDTSYTLNTLPKSSNSKENQNVRTVTQNASYKVNETEENMVSSSIAQNTEVPKAGSQSAGGSQFEQKTFSRMRDGETVEVKYKVYIPKKTPALARRKLQR